MPDPSASDFITDLRRAANAPVSPSFIAVVLHRSRRRRRLRLIGAFAAPALSAAVLIPLGVHLTQHHRLVQDRLGMTASAPQAAADAEGGSVTSPEPSATTTFSCGTGAAIDVVGRNGASTPTAAARGFALPGDSTQGDVFIARPGQANTEQEVLATRDGLQHVRFSVVQGADGSWSVSSFQIVPGC